MSTIGQALTLAVRYHQAGDLQQAEQLYHQILQVEPNHVDALHLLGLVAVRNGNHGLACDYIRRALRLKPDFTEAHNNLGSVLVEMGLLEDAAAAYRQALRLKPRYAEAHSNLGSVLRQQGKLDEAVASLQQALRYKSDFADAHNHLGSVLRDQGKIDEAVTRYRIAVKLKPDFADAHSNLGNALREAGKPAEALGSLQQALRLRPSFAEAHSHLGNVLRDLGRPGEAIAEYEQALRLNPHFAEAHNNLGVVLQEQGRVDEAAAHYREALRLKPNFAQALKNVGAIQLQQANVADAVSYLEQTVRVAPKYADAHSELGNALAEQGRLAEAEGQLREAVRLRPNQAETLNNLAVVLGKQGKWNDAVATFRDALQVDPNHGWIHYGLGAHLLLLGNFEEGWPEYEWRWRTREFTPRPFHQPRWDGGPLDGKVILLHAEQGLGDTLQFIRYAPLVKESGAKVVVECQSSLVDVLAQTPGIDTLLAEGTSLPPFDVYAPLLSLPAIFETDVASIPVDVPYVFADAARVERWRDEIEAATGFKIGIAWKGRPTHQRDRERSVSPEAMAPLAAVSGVRVFSLQVGPGREQLTTLGSRLPITDLGGRFDLASFADAAAAIKNLDLIITVDTALAHLAGAMNVPVWVALPFAPDWRWQLGREDSPWYPSMRLFRQPMPGDWNSVFARITAELAKTSSV
jgi:tetratricopeptide (TPR) repeat protein